MSNLSDRLSGARPALSPFVLNALVATYLLAACNGTFWSHLLRIFGNRPLAGVGFALVIWALILLTISLMAVRRLQKPVLVALLLIGGVASYYVDVLGVVIDRDMIQNAATTTFAESRHLITPRFLGHVALFGGLPAMLVLWVRVQRAGLKRAFAGWAMVTAGAAAMVVGLLFTDFKAYASVLRENKELLASAQPLAPLAASLRYARMMLRSTSIVVAPTGKDARPGQFLSQADKPVLMVIVAGETARAQNWSLGGYARPTNPALAARDVLYFSDVTSCGTATAVSLPCMFSPLTADEYSFTGGLSHENLLDVLVRAGFKAEWWDNNTGHKDVAARIPSRRMTAEDGAEFCQPECTDGVFLKRLEETAASITGNTVIVLHQIGSHGPSYWLRYPADREVFGPACQTPDLSACSEAEIVNAYDNTIAYTDEMLAAIIDLLAAEDRVIPAMFYVSDHGESLGENGLYLHGAPKFMAPSQQTHVPMVVWLSDRFQSTLGLEQACLGKQVTSAISHDNMFSTILGLLDVRTSAVDPALDLTNECRTRAS